MLFITKHDTPPSNKASKLAPKCTNTKPPGHETIFITLQSLALSKHASFEKGKLCQENNHSSLYYNAYHRKDEQTRFHRICSKFYYDKAFGHTFIFPSAYLPTCLRNITTNFRQAYIMALLRLLPSHPTPPPRHQTLLY